MTFYGVFPPVFSEAHLCQCRKCWHARRAADPPDAPDPISRMSKMILCAKCGNKRCPNANDHDHPCTNSNEPGQSGSAY